MRMQANRRHIHGRIPTCKTAFYSAPSCHGGVFDSRRWVSRSFPVRTRTRPSGHPESFVRTRSPRPTAVSHARPREQLRSAAVWRRIRVLKVGRIKRGWSGETEALTDAHRPTARTTSLTAKEIDFFERDRGFESLYLSPGSLSSSDRCAFRHTSTSASGWAYLNKPPMTEAKKITTPSKSNPVTIFLFGMRRAAGLRG